MADTPSRGGVAGTYLQSILPVPSYGITLSASGQGSGWFGPSAPMAPVAPPDVVGRQFDYPVGFNLLTQPRAYAPIGFRELRALADGYDLLRTVIETRKDQVSRMSWTIKSRDEGAKDKDDPRVTAVTAFLQRPDGVNGWADWVRPVLEDLFVIDAPALYMQRDRGGRLLQMVQIDGATIKPIIDDWGRTPRPFGAGSQMIYPAAYQQVLKGLPAVDYSTRDMLYRPRNRRVHTPYGMSPVEQIVTTINIALRRQLFTLSYFTEGSIPDALIQVPQTWTPDQIVTYQTHWDSYFAGDLARRRRAKFVPGGVGAGGVHETKTPDLKGDFDEWLAKIVCFAFSISPQALTRQMNRASADTQKQLAEEEGLEPILLWIKSLVDDVLKFEFGADDLEFAWDNDDEVDQAQQLTVLTGYTAKAIMTINEARDRLGLEPLPDPEASQGMIITASGAVPLGQYQQQQDQAHQNAQLLAEARAKQEAQGVPPAQNGGGNAQDVRDGGAPGDVVKFSADQPRDVSGRFTSGDAGTSVPSVPDHSLTTRQKAIGGILLATAAAYAVSALTHKKVPYKDVLAGHFKASDLDKQMEALHKASVSTPITEAEKLALRQYAYQSFAKINKDLRLNRKPTDQIATIDAAIAKSSMPENAILYRGLNKDRSKRIINAGAGAELVDKGFASTSLSKQVAGEFAGPKGYVLSINVDKGSSALPLVSGMRMHQEFEVLMPRSSAFKILNVDHDERMIYMQHTGTAMGKAAEVDDDVPDHADKFVWYDGDVIIIPAPDGDTTAEDYAGYVQPQPDTAKKVAKADVSGEARDDRGEWTSGGDHTAEDLQAAKDAAFAIAKGIAITAAGSLAVALAPEVSAVATVAAFATYTADAAFYEAGIKSAKVILSHMGVDTAEVEERLKGIVGLGKEASGASVDGRLRVMLGEVSDHLRDEMIAHVEGRHAQAVNLGDITATIKTACENYKAKLQGLGKAYSLDKRRLGTAWRSPEPIPFDRPATAKAEAAIMKRIGKALEALGEQVAAALRVSAEKVAKAAPPDDPEDIEERAQQRADEIVSEFDFSVLQDQASGVGDDLERVVDDTVERAVAQIGPDDNGQLVNQVNARAVAIARERAAELVGMKYDAAGDLVPSDDAEMAITDTTRIMLRQTIADGLANNVGLDAIADDIESTYAFSDERAAVIAATEVSRANSMAALESYRSVADLGIPVRKAWLVTTACCDACAENASAGAIDLDDTFPSGDDTPPGHPNCRCSLSPIVGETEMATKAYNQDEPRDATGRWSKFGSEISPTKVVSADNVEPLHGVYDHKYKDALVEQMSENGWVGRPIPVFEGGNGIEAMTGSHRIAAAREAGIDIPIYVSEEAGGFEDEDGNTIGDLTGRDDDEAVAAFLEQAGDTDGASLMRAEVNANRYEYSRTLDIRD